MDSKVYIVYKREILRFNEWRDEVVCVCHTSESADKKCKKKGLNYWYCEHQVLD